MKAKIFAILLILSMFSCTDCPTHKETKSACLAVERSSSQQIFRLDILGESIITFPDKDGLNIDTLTIDSASAYKEIIGTISDFKYGDLQKEECSSESYNEMLEDDLLIWFSGTYLGAHQSMRLKKILGSDNDFNYLLMATLDLGSATSKFGKVEFIDTIKLNRVFTLSNGRETIDSIHATGRKTNLQFVLKTQWVHQNKTFEVPNSPEGCSDPLLN